jgi:hypothetical protein
MIRRGHRLLAFLLVAIVLPACATTTPDSRQAATSGPVSWEVVDMTHALRNDGLGIRWYYVLVLKEKRGVGIQFERIEAALFGPTVGAGEVSRQSPYRERLAPNGELRVNLVSTFAYINPATAGQARDIREYAYGLTAQRTFSGKDDNGQPVRFVVKVPLDRGTGRRLIAPKVAPGPSPLPSARVTDAAALAGEWVGHYRVDGYDVPLKLVVAGDGSFQATESDPVRNRYKGTLAVRDERVTWSMGNGSGPLGLYDEGGRRALAGRVAARNQSGQPFDYDVRVVESRSATASPVAEPARVATPAPTPPAPAAPPRVAAPGPAATPAPAPAVPAPSASGPAIAFRHPADQGRVSDSATVVVADISSDRGLAMVGVSVNGMRVYEHIEAGTKAVPLNVPITLREGSNVVVVSATDAGGGVRQEVRTVTYQLPAGIRVSYRVHGSAMNLNLKYRSPDGRTEEKKVLLPLDAAWELLFSAREGDSLEVTAQNAGEAGWVTCEIVVEGTAIAARTEEGRAPTVTCKGIVTPPR